MYTVQITYEWDIYIMIEIMVFTKLIISIFELFYFVCFIAFDYYQIIIII